MAVQGKPVLGVLNRRAYLSILQQTINEEGGVHLDYFYNKRVNSLAGAIQRYAEARESIPTDWIIEYNELVYRN